MFGLGTIINTLFVIIGSILGLFFKKGLRENIQDILMKASGIAILFIGISGVLSYMLTIENGTIGTRGTMLLIFSMTLGSLTGELLNIEGKIERFGLRLRDFFHARGDSSFIDGFVNTSLIICIGAMAIVGAIEDGVHHDISTLTAKSVLDFVIVLVNASVYGKGVLCSAIPIFFYQGSITVLAAAAGSFVSDTLITQLSFIGAALIFCIGINTTFGKIFKVGNMLPALFFPIFTFLLGYFFPAAANFFS